MNKTAYLINCHNVSLQTMMYGPYHARAGRQWSRDPNHLIQIKWFRYGERKEDPDWVKLCMTYV